MFNSLQADGNSDWRVRIDIRCGIDLASSTTITGLPTTFAGTIFQFSPKTHWKKLKQITRGRVVYLRRTSARPESSPTNKNHYRGPQPDIQRTIYNQRAIEPARAWRVYLHLPAGQRPVWANAYNLRAACTNDPIPTLPFCKLQTFPINLIKKKQIESCKDPADPKGILIFSMTVEEIHEESFLDSY